LKDIHTEKADRALLSKRRQMPHLAEPFSDYQRFAASIICPSRSSVRCNRPYRMQNLARRSLGVLTQIDERLSTQDRAPVVLSALIEPHIPLFVDDASTKSAAFDLIDPYTEQRIGTGIRHEGFDPPPETAVQSGLIVWLTGLSSAGKTAISSEVCMHLCRRGITTELLDGDAVREHVSKDLGFTREDRADNVRRLGFLANILARKAEVVLVAAISPFRKDLDAVRRSCSNFIEVYVNASTQTCESRDVKGLYRRARRGEILRFTGVSDPYEPPLNPEIECCTSDETLSHSTSRVMVGVFEHLQRRHSVFEIA
jgi:adenylyl-sulfate kinase